MSEMCCTPLAGNTGRKNYEKNLHLCTIAEFVGLYLACIDNKEKLVKQQYLLQMSPNMVNFGSL